MMTNSGGTDHLMNFSYKNNIGTKEGRDTHYTNDYLWAPEGDPYGFVLRSRYSTINGNGFNATVVTTTGELPKAGVEYTASETPSDYEATYTNAMPFISRLIIHTLKGKTLPPPSGGTAGDDSMSNGIYEMFTGDAAFGNSFLMHPTTAYIDTSDPEFSSYYMMRDASGKPKLTLQSARTLQNDNDANWYLSATTEQLLPYFERAGYVGGISPTRVAANFNFQDYYDQLKTAKESGTTLEFSQLRKIQETVYDGTYKDATGATIAEGTERSSVTLPLTFVSTNLVNMADGYYRIAGFSTAQLNAYEKAHATEGHKGIQGQRYISGYRFKSEETNSKPLHFFETTKDAATIHTFADLAAATPFTAEAPLQGNIELLPADFDPGRKYPVVMHQYSGPGSQQVVDSWSAGNMGGCLYEQYLAQEGFVCVCVDGRGTGGRGREFEQCTYLKLGQLESHDQVEAAIWLGQQPYVDKDRIAIWGWSYGGFTTLMSMSEGHPVFAAGVAVAAPCSWRYYDTIYTERYMRTPGENGSGYDVCPISRADKLSGKLLLVHGLADDNVHFRNVAEYTEALEQADKDFRELTYTNRNHGIYGGNTRNHLFRQITEHFKSMK